MVAFCGAATFVVALAGLTVGSILFPVGRVTTLSGDTLTLPQGIARIGIAAVLVAVLLLGLAAIGVFASTMTDVAIGAMAATLGLLLLSAIVDAIPQLSALHPWLLTHNWLSFGDVMRTHIIWSGITRNLGIQAAYVLIFGSAAWARFTPRDILA